MEFIAFVCCLCIELYVVIAWYKTEKRIKKHVERNNKKSKRYDSQKLRLLATWFDMESEKREGWNDSTEIQDFLRDLADKIERI